MTVESATFLDGLNTALPPGSDDRAEGDNHLRLIKATLKNTFPGFTGRINRTLAKATNFTADITYNHSIVIATANAVMALDPAATLGAGFSCFVATDGGTLTVDPAGTEQVNGANTVELPNGMLGLLFTNGTKFFLMAVSLSFPLTVPAGGTGRAALTPYNVLAAAAVGTDPIAFLAPGDAGKVLTSQGPAALPAFLPASGPFTAAFESAELAIVGASQQAVAHGLGGVPKLATAALRCKTATADWLVGDEIQIMSHAMPSGFFSTNLWLAGQGYSVWANATQIGVGYNLPNNQLLLQRKGGGAGINIPFVGVQGGLEGHDAFSFRWVLRAWR